MLRFIGSFQLCYGSATTGGITDAGSAGGGMTFFKRAMRAMVPTPRAGLIIERYLGWVGWRLMFRLEWAAHSERWADLYDTQ